MTVMSASLAMQEAMTTFLRLPAALDGGDLQTALMAALAGGEALPLSAPIAVELTRGMHPREITAWVAAATDARLVAVLGVAPGAPFPLALAAATALYASPPPAHTAPPAAVAPPSPAGDLAASVSALCGVVASTHEETARGGSAAVSSFAVLHVTPGMLARSSLKAGGPAMRAALGLLPTGSDSSTVLRALPYAIVANAWTGADVFGASTLGAPISHAYDCIDLLQYVDNGFYGAVRTSANVPFHDALAQVLIGDPAGLSVIVKSLSLFQEVPHVDGMPFTSATPSTAFTGPCLAAHKVCIALECIATLLPGVLADTRAPVGAGEAVAHAFTTASNSFSSLANDAALHGAATTLSRAHGEALSVADAATALEGTFSTLLVHHLCRQAVLHRQEATDLFTEVLSSAGASAADALHAASPSVDPSRLFAIPSSFDPAWKREFMSLIAQAHCGLSRGMARLLAENGNGAGAAAPVPAPPPHQRAPPPAAAGAGALGAAPPHPRQQRREAPTGFFLLHDAALGVLGHTGPSPRPNCVPRSALDHPAGSGAACFGFTVLNKCHVQACRFLHPTSTSAPTLAAWRVIILAKARHDPAIASA